ncbi:hypothetical protein MNBD_GAMMA20-1686 [hydrothermal vent metagenome]|uniref:DUF4398 domain-containing protein n=1 Tax=hydrothermal vent metagenome TaxID=652676 RepID=A0A3B1ABD6_9ZZZZ
MMSCSPLSHLCRIFFAGLLFAGLLSACAGVPVQEMSDARQAVEAAHQADARIYAPEELQAAENLLQRAEEALTEGYYRQAREDAEAAREQAVSAQSKSSP